MANPTLANVKTAVNAKGYDTDPTTLVEAINSAYQEVLAARRWPFLEASVAYSGVAVGGSYALSAITDLLHLDRVWLVQADDTHNGELAPWTPQHLRAAEIRDNTYGEPEAWTQYAGSIVFHPKPSRIIRGYIDYVKEATALTADADVLVIPRRYIDTVVWGGVAQLAYRQRDYASADRAERKRDDAVQRMIRAYGIEQRQGGRVVEATGFWDDMA